MQRITLDKMQHQQASISDVMNRVRTDEILFNAGLLRPDQLHRDAQPDQLPDTLRLCRDYIQRSGAAAPPLSEPRQLVERAISSSDLPELLANVASKAATLGFNNAAEIWPFITRTVPVRDFREFKQVSAPELPQVPIIGENGELTRVQLGDDFSETGQITPRAMILSITREAIINNDLGRVVRDFFAAGAAVSRTIGDAVLAILTGNPLMGHDLTALFDAAHGNVGAAGKPTVTALDEIAGLMASQTGPSGTVLNIRPRFVVAGAGLSSTLAFLRGAMNTLDPNDQSTGNISTLTDARITGSSWFAIADPLLHDGIQLCYPESGSLFRFEQKFGGTSRDNLHFLIGADFYALPVDFRGLAFNTGA